MYVACKVIIRKKIIYFLYRLRIFFAREKSYKISRNSNLEPIFQKASLLSLRAAMKIDLKNTNNTVFLQSEHNDI